MPTFLHTPAFGASESSSPRASVVALGTYQQRLTFGINPFRDSWAVRFPARTTPIRDQIYAFLSGLGGTAPFTWTTPFGETAQFVCPKWDMALDSCALSTIETTFDLQYVPGLSNLATPAAPTTAFTWAVDFAASKSYESTARTLPLGESYTQRLVSGLSSQKEEWRVALNNRTNAERDAIRTFLRGARGVSSFVWANPIALSTEKYTCSKWTITYESYNNNNIQATFERVFEP